MAEQPPARLQRAAAKSILGCACEADSSGLMWVGGKLYGWWVTLHIRDRAVVHAVAPYAGGGHWVAGKGMLP